MRQGNAWDHRPQGLGPYRRVDPTSPQTFGFKELATTSFEHNTHSGSLYFISHTTQPSRRQQSNQLYFDISNLRSSSSRHSKATNAEAS